MRTIVSGALIWLLAGLFLITQPSESRAETFIGTTVESRVIVGVRTDATAVQSLLPEGWTSLPFPRGPLKGANLLVSFVDGILMVDAEDKPLSPASRRAVILLGLGKDMGGDSARIFVLRIYTSEPENDPYGVNVAAEITRGTNLTGPAAEGRQSSDTWGMTTAGGTLEMSLDYTTGRRGWSAGEALSFSAATPDFHRIYRYDSVTDVVMSMPMGKPLSGAFSLTHSVPELASLLDGREEIIAILDIPVRVRKVFLP